MSQSIYNEEEVLIEDDVDWGQGAGDQASHIVHNNLTIGSQVTPTNSAVSQATPMMPEDLNNPM